MNSNLSDKEREFVKAKLNSPGDSLKKLALQIGICETTAWKYSNSPQVRAALDEAHAEALNVIRDMRLKAAFRLAALLDSEHESIRIQAIKLILGEALLKPIDPVKKDDAPIKESDQPYSHDDWMRIIKHARGLPV